MTDIERFKEQLTNDALFRVRDLEMAYKCARKSRMDLSSPAKDYCGDFTGLDEKIRLTDVPDYVRFLIKHYGLAYEPNFD